MKNTNTTTRSSNTKESQNKPRFTSLTIDGESWKYFFADQYYDFSVYITGPDRTEYSFVRSFYKNGWAKKIRKPFVSPELIKRYIQIFIKSASQ